MKFLQGFRDQSHGIWLIQGNEFAGTCNENSRKIILIIIWFGDSVTVMNLTKCDTNSKVRAMSAQQTIFTSFTAGGFPHNTAWTKPPRVQTCQQFNYHTQDTTDVFNIIPRTEKVIFIVFQLLEKYLAKNDLWMAFVCLERHIWQSASKGCLMGAMISGSEWMDSVSNKCYVLGCHNNGDSEWEKKQGI